MSPGLEIAFELDRRWHWLRGEMQESKKPALYNLVKILNRLYPDYAIIGGVAVQVHHQNPRTTIDIDVAVLDRGKLPQEALRQAGFQKTGTFAHSENWIGPGSTPIQFTDDPAIRPAILRAQTIPLDDVELKVIRAVDLLHEKLRAAADPARRRSKQLQDLADAQALIEQNPELSDALSPQERDLLK